MRCLIAAGALVLTPMLAVAQATSNGVRTDSTWSQETPAISVWFEGQSQQLDFGAPARVRFRTEQDAYVIVGRVDGEGHMQILWPQSATSHTFVPAGQEVLVRSRQYGSFASFVSYERFGTGFVFAIASYEPLDLSRLQPNDFQRYGGSMSYFSNRFIGRADRAIERFAPYVLFSPDTPYDFDVAYYSVNSPRYASSSSFCGTDQSGLAYDEYSRGMCSQSYYLWAICNSVNLGGFSLGYAGSCYNSYYGGRFGRPWVIANNPNPPPPVRPAADTGRKPNVKLIPKLGGPDTVGTKLNALQRSLEPPHKVTTVDGQTAEDDLNRIYSIPRRAIDNLRRDEPGDAIPPGSRGGATGRFDGNRPAPVPVDGIEGSPGGNGRPSRAGGETAGQPARRDGRERDVDPVARGGIVSRHEPPVRESPRNPEPPPRQSPRDEPQVRTYSPPPRIEAPRNNPPPRSEPAHAAPPHRDAPPPQHTKPDKKP